MLIDDDPIAFVIPDDSIKCTVVYHRLEFHRKGVDIDEQFHILPFGFCHNITAYAFS